MFITSTTRELMPVSEVEGLKIHHARAVMDRLQTKFTNYVKDYIASAVDGGFQPARGFSLAQPERR